MVRVLIADNVPQVRRELRVLLQIIGDIEVVGEASDGLEAVRQTEALHPDVVVMDLEMPILDGCIATQQIKTRLPSCRVIVLTIHDGEGERQKARQAGADEFIVKGAPIDLLTKAIASERSQ